MFRVWDTSLMICFSVSLMFVGGESSTELPPIKNLTFKWETPFTLNLTWEKPKDLEPNCNVNYTVDVRNAQNCSEKPKQDNSQTKRTPNTTCKFNVSNENGLCISVTMNPENCGTKNPSPPSEMFLHPPPVLLVANRSYEYFNERMLKCIWSPVADNETVMKCNEMRIGECIIHDKFDMTRDMFYLFNGTYEGEPVNNTFKDKRPAQYVKLKKPSLQIQKVGNTLHFKTNASDFTEFKSVFDLHCYKYNYTYSKCDKTGEKFQIDRNEYVVDYESNCKYKARVQIIVSEKCGENRDDTMPALLALIIIPLVVSCCLIVSLVLLRRMAEDMRSPADSRLYVPIEEIVESRISLEPETPLIQNPTHKQV
ncbi:Interleukin-13 receptor subunit alpha-1 [Labeo rohita]|uniref:Interleukin-13 receptor subunit alpha-1 n=1 Tax=Labeo rohita TaxID=84645 RepID=A0ABQ8MJ21_LABRO|nr:Interleukin-13 receptor subunit alpha-1 [Labeo rohita]